MKEFVTTGICNPGKHYMVDIGERLEKIKAMVDAGKYFCINRARQYGKTTTLAALEEYLRDRYIVVDLDFQDIGGAGYNDEYAFSRSFAIVFAEAWNEQHEAENDSVEEKVSELLSFAENVNFQKNGNFLDSSHFISTFLHCHSTMNCAGNA